MTPPAIDWRGEAEATYQTTAGWRRDLHEHPELAFGEERTAACIAAVLGLTMEHHNPRFDFDERALPVGAALLAAGAVRCLNEKA